VPGSNSSGRIPRTVRRPIPLPGRARWAWLLGTRFRRWRLRRLLRLVVPRIEPASTVVDVGSGPGFDAEVLAGMLPGDRVRRWVLLDPQAEMVRQARGVPPGHDAASWSPVIADAVALPVRSGAADVVLSLGVICCVAEEYVPAAIAETARTTRPGGWLVFGVLRRRGDVDLARWEAAGFRLVSHPRPGQALLQKLL
jgi:SAM-dependent methyltransferase